MDFIPKSLWTRFLVVDSAQANPLASPLIVCLGWSLMDWAIASTFPDVQKVRSLPDLSINGSRSLDVIHWTVLNPTPRPAPLKPPTSLVPPCWRAGAPRHADFSVDNPCLKVDGKGHRRSCGVSGSPRSSFR